jgi:hypothetical protein
MFKYLTILTISFAHLESFSFLTLMSGSCKTSRHQINNSSHQCNIRGGRELFMMEDMQQSTTQDGFDAELFENASNGAESTNICAAEDDGRRRCR